MMFYDVLIATRLRFDKQSLPVVGPLPQSASVCLSGQAAGSCRLPRRCAECHGRGPDLVRRSFDQQWLGTQELSAF